MGLIDHLRQYSDKRIPGVLMLIDGRQVKVAALAVIDDRTVAAIRSDTGFKMDINLARIRSWIPDREPA